MRKALDSLFFDGSCHYEVVNSKCLIIALLVELVKWLWGLIF